MKQQRFILMMLVIVASIFFQNCSNETSQMSRLQVILVDAPGDYEKVNIDLKDILINRTDDDSSWESIGNVQQGIYNLLDYTGGAEALLADSELPSGEIKQIRLLLGPNNSLILKNKDSVKLDTPSAQQSGLKLNVNATLEGGVLYSFILDFDADKSIVKAGNSGKYILKPVIRVITEATSGAIAGEVVFPTDVSSLKVSAKDLNDTTNVVSTQTDEFGNFFMKGVLPGSYDLMFEKSVDDGMGSTTSEIIVPITPENLNPVNVTLGFVTDVGKVTFE